MLAAIRQRAAKPPEIGIPLPATSDRVGKSAAAREAMMVKRLIVCCDGTWNDSDDGNEFTNVSRLAWAVEPLDARNGNIAQIVYYQSGVGTGGDLFSKLGGGGVGLGLSRNVRDAYAFLANNYAPGDEIFLFGFSRGAYTARSIGGVIGYAGLVHKSGMDRFSHLWEGY